MKTSLIRNVLLCLTLVCFYAVNYHTLLGYRADHASHRQQSSSWNLPPLVLKILAGEFKGLVADLIVLEAGARLGTELVRNPQGGFRVVPKQYDWPAIHQLFVGSMALDPAFAQTSIMAQGWLPWEPANMVAETQEILKIAALNRPWDWRPTHDRGFNEYYFRNNPGEAGKLFLEAAKTPNVPSFLAILGGRLAQKGGETQSAIVIMKSMLAAKDKEEPGYGDMQDRLHALEGVLEIEKAAAGYEKNMGRKPASLAELTASGMLTALPSNPYKLEYCMDAAGSIYFDKPDCLKQKTGEIKP
jgi:hypothetical protein